MQADRLTDGGSPLLKAQRLERQQTLLWTGEDAGGKDISTFVIHEDQAGMRSQTLFSCG